jgi:hypothetical protein
VRVCITQDCQVPAHCTCASARCSPRDCPFPLLACRYVNKSNLSGFTALHYAVWNGRQVRLAEGLVCCCVWRVAGADTSTHAMRLRGRTPCCEAAWSHPTLVLCHPATCRAWWCRCWRLART